MRLERLVNGAQHTRVCCTFNQTVTTILRYTPSPPHPLSLKQAIVSEPDRGCQRSTSEGRGFVAQTTQAHTGRCRMGDSLHDPVLAGGEVVLGVVYKGQPEVEHQVHEQGAHAFGQEHLTGGRSRNRNELNKCNVNVEFNRY